MNEAITLFSTFFKRRRASEARATEADVRHLATIDLIDHYNKLHFHDRNQIQDRIRELESRLHALATRGESA